MDGEWEEGRGREGGMGEVMEDGHHSFLRRGCASADQILM